MQYPIRNLQNKQQALTLSMDCDHIKTCALKVNINCCKACPIKVKKRLLKINGVISVDVDPEKNLVSITGIVDHIQLIKKMKKMGKKAELVERDDADNNNNNNNNNYNDFGQQVQSRAPQNLIQAEYNEDMASPGEFLEDIWGGRDDQVPPCYGPRMMMHAGYVGDMPRPPPSYDHYYGPRLMPPGGYGGDHYYGPRLMPTRRIS